MAEFDETVEKLTKATDKLSDAVDKLSAGADSGDPGSGGAGATEEKREAEQLDRDRNSYLETIANALGGAKAGAAGDDGAQGKKMGGIFAGIAGAIGALGRGIGMGISGFMTGVALAAPAALVFVGVMTAFGAGIAAFILALGAGAFLTAKMFPSIAENLKAFDDVDGANLVSVGKGLFELGVGLGATGLGGAFLSIGNLVSVITDGIAGIFGAKSGEESLFEKLEKFGAVKLNKGHITNNAAAIKEYATAMIEGAKASVGTLAIDITNFMSAGINAIGSLLGFEGGIDALINGMKKLSEDHGIDKEKIKTFAEGLSEYTKAMALGAAAKGLQLIGEIANFAQQGVKAITEMIGGDDFLTSTIKGMVAMSSATGIDRDKIETFAGALVAYTGAMAVGMIGKALQLIGEIANFAQQGVKAITEMIGGDDFLTSTTKGMVAMSSATGIDREKIEIFAGALVVYTGAIAVGMVGKALQLIGEIANFAQQGVAAITGMIGGDDFLTSTTKGMVAMSSATGIDGAKIKIFADALVEYTAAMTIGMAAKGVQVVGEILNFAQQGVAAITGMIGGDDFLTSTTKGMVAMSSAEGINTVKIQQFANALVAYTGAMHEGARGKSKELLASMANLATTAVDGITGLMGGEGGLPALITSLKTLSKDHGIDKEKIKTFAEGVSVYATAMSSGAKGMKAGAGIALSNFATQAVNAIGSLLGFEGGIDALLINLKKLSGPETDGIDSTKIGRVAVAMQAYATAMDAAATAGGATVWDAVNTLVTGVVKSIGGWLGITEGKSALDKLKDFAKFSLTPEEQKQINLNAAGITVYSKAMAEMSKTKLPLNFGDFLSSLLDGFSSFFSKDVDPMADLAEFSTKGKGINVAQIKKNVEALSAFAKLGAGWKKGEAPDIAGFAKSLKESLPHLHAAMQGYGEGKKKVLGYGDPSLEEDYTQAGKNLKSFLNAFTNLDIGSEHFMGSSNFNDFASDLWSGIDELQLAINGPITKDPKNLGLASKEIKWAEAAENISVLLNALGGTGGAGSQMTSLAVDSAARAEGRAGTAPGGNVITTIAPSTVNNASFGRTQTEAAGSAGVLSAVRGWR